MENEAYQSLIELGRETKLVGNTQSLLGWDQEVIMPAKGVEYRGKQMAWFSGWLHDKLTAPKVGDWISSAEAAAKDGGAGAEAQANLREWRHGYDRATNVPKRLVEEMAEVQVLAKSAWAEARAKSDFSLFSASLQNLINLCREEAECHGYEETLYDALLDKFERGATTRRLDETLGGLRDLLVPIVEEVTAKSGFDDSRLAGEYPIAKQEAFNQEVAEAMGFDFEAGRIDTAVHPFCSGLAPFDTRLTTRYDEADFRSSLFGVLHEAGHGLYEQGLNPNHHGQPIGSAVSLGVHESQSRLWENHVGRSRAFWEKWLPRAQHYFPHLASISIDEMFDAVNQANMSFIRVESDEVTYDLHILLRYEIEKAIFAGDIEVEDVPGEWNRKFEEFFGLAVDKDSNGCLQDIHWSMGIFGYFPTYSLGNINAAHLAAAARSDSAIASGMDQGDFSGLLDWMRTRIHARGSILLPDDLITEAAGRPADAESLARHLRERYSR